jgi:integrase
MTFDNAIARACRKAGKLAKLNYGQANGFTAHSLRHTFITDLMEKTGNDAGTVMKYSGHKTLESFSIYLHPTEQGRILATQAMESIALFLRGFEGQEGQQGEEGQTDESANPLQTEEVAV